MIRSLSTVLVASSLCLAACSSSNSSNEAPTVCAVEGNWTETEAVYEGEPDTACVQLASAIKVELSTMEVIKNDTTYSAVRAGDKFLTAWTESPNSCNLTAKQQDATGTFTIGSTKYDLTFTAEGTSSVTIVGNTVTITSKQTVNAKPALDGTPCTLTHTVTATHD